MSMRPGVRFVKTVALSAALGCGTKAPENGSPDGPPPDRALPACQTDAIRERLAAHGIRDKVSIVADGAPCPP